MRPTVGFLAAVTLLAGAGLFLWLGNPFSGTELAGTEASDSSEPSQEETPAYNEPYEVMGGPFEDGGGAVSMNIETDAETPQEMEAVGRTVRQDYPEPGRLALTMIYHSGESHTPAAETGFVAFEGESVEVTSYVSEHKMLCERAYAYEEPDPSPEWGCWRWFDPAEEPEDTPPVAEPETTTQRPTEQPYTGGIARSGSDYGSCDSILGDELPLTSVCEKSTTDLRGASDRSLSFIGARVSMDDGIERRELLPEALAANIQEETGVDLVVVTVSYTLRTGAPGGANDRGAAFSSEEAREAYEEYEARRPSAGE